MIPMTDVVNSPQSHQQEGEKRGRWGSQVEYLLSVVGFSVGFSNVLRFPYICIRNGGGAFLIPYIACMTLCGLPLFYLEVAIGQFRGKGAAHVWSVCPLMKGLGIGMLIMSGGSALYYTVNCAWSVYYLVFACSTALPWANCHNPWNTDSCVKSVEALTQPYKVLSISSGLDQLGSIKWELALCLFASWFLIFATLVKGVRSVGKVVYVTATLPYGLLFILLVRGLTLPGGTDGALFYITPNFSKLSNIQVWIEACVQVFFSLGPAWGGVITLSSFNKFNSNCLRNAIICTCVGAGTSLFAGGVVFSILGFMAHSAGVPITDVVSSGMSCSY
ncbi:sodium- and chloride-dependent GABA transporter 3-like [Haliotis rufescens]|uniref:sodium- and chloride-dependent GABA transporter 3-like n=1 Tax=Haliotis rufescens TaxID=6454 RepID=UPI00201FAEFD|nr:sodium- and chloride-dependent GABA transporter 3-like [Haliotis rufescens]